MQTRCKYATISEVYLRSTTGDASGRAAKSSTIENRRRGSNLGSDDSGRLSRGSLCPSTPRGRLHRFLGRFVFHLMAMLGGGRRTEGFTIIIIRTSSHFHRDKSSEPLGRIRINRRRVSRSLESKHIFKKGHLEARRQNPNK